MKIVSATGTAQIVGAEFSNYVNQIHMKIQYKEESISKQQAELCMGAEIGGFQVSDQPGLNREIPTQQ